MGGHSLVLSHTPPSLFWFPSQDLYKIWVGDGGRGEREGTSSRDHWIVNEKTSFTLVQTTNHLTLGKTSK